MTITLFFASTAAAFSLAATALASSSGQGPGDPTPTNTEQLPLNSMAKGLFGSVFSSPGGPQIKSSQDSTNLDLKFSYSAWKKGNKFTASADFSIPISAKSNANSFTTFDELSKVFTLQGQLTYMIKGPGVEVVIPGNGTTPAKKVTKSQFFFGFSLSGVVGAEQHSFYDEISFNQINSTKNPWSVNPQFVIFFPHEKFSVTGGFKHQVSFLDQDTTSKYQNSTSNCTVGSFGAPSRTVRNMITSEIHYQIYRNLAIAPQYQYDVDHRVSSFTVPIFLTDLKKVGGAGGIEFTWRSDTRSTGIGFFYNRSFSWMQSP